jgi:hypothetical protein
MDKESDDDEEEGPPDCKIELSELRYHLNYVITFISSSPGSEVQPYYSHFRILREIIVLNTKLRYQMLSSSQLAY